MLGKFRRVHCRQEAAERMPDENEPVLAQNAPDALDVRHLRADAQRVFQARHVGKIISRREPVEWARGPAAAALIVIVKFKPVCQRVQRRRRRRQRKPRPAVNEQDRPPRPARKVMQPDAGFHRPEFRVAGRRRRFQRPRKINAGPDHARPVKRLAHGPPKPEHSTSEDRHQDGRGQKHFLFHTLPVYTFQQGESQAGIEGTPDPVADRRWLQGMLWQQHGAIKPLPIGRGGIGPRLRTVGQNDIGQSLPARTGLQIGRIINPVGAAI